MSLSRSGVLLAVAAVAALTWSSWPSQAQTGAYGVDVVRLYSGGQVVGEWQAVAPGRVEGDAYVFPVRKGVRDVDVRIRGTYSVERKP